MSKARRHHYIPQCYLRTFTRNGAKNSKLFAVDIIGRKSFWTTPANVCVVRDFNRVDAPPLEPDALETSLSKFEADAAGALSTIIRDKSLQNRDAWICVLNLMAITAVRNPHFRRQMEEFQSKILRMMSRMHVQTRERWDATIKGMLRDGALENQPPVSYEQMKKFVEDDQYTIEFGHGHHTAAEFKVLDTVLETLANRKWSLLQIDGSDGEFITTDLPVCLMRTSGDAKSQRHPVGHGLMGTTVLFPISSHLLALGSFESKGGSAKIGRKNAAILNLALALHCDSTVFASTDRFPVANNEGDGISVGADFLTRIQSSPRRGGRRKGTTS